VTDLWRVVLDTNVYVAAFLSKSSTSPTNEILDRWEAGEFVLLFTDAILEEVAETFDAKDIEREITLKLITSLRGAAERVEVSEIPPVVIADPDDDVILAYAVNGGADVLVTYDPHLLDLGAEYRGVRIVEALPFLWALRGDESSPSMQRMEP